jgi:nitroreductase
MDALETISQRASIRNFESKPIAKEILEKLVDAGRLAPSARNVQPWEFVVITSPQTIRQLAQMGENARLLEKAAACIAVFCRDTKYYLEDGCAATENILLAATTLGIGSCWVAGDKKEYCKNVSILLGVPAELKLVSLLALGYSQKSDYRAAKRLLSEVFHWEKFSP